MEIEKFKKMETPSPSVSGEKPNPQELFSTILDVEEGYVPDYVRLRSTLTDTMLTVDVTYENLEKLDTDEKVKRFSLARTQRGT